MVILDLEILPLIVLTTTHFKADIQQLLFLYMFIIHLERHEAEASVEKDSSTMVGHKRNVGELLPFGNQRVGPPVPSWTFPA